MKKAFLVVALLAVLPWSSFAEESEFEVPEDEDKVLKTSLSIYPFIEKYKWAEFFNGGQVEENKGELYGAGAQVSFDTGGALARIKGEWFQGKLDGSGVYQSGMSWQTDVTLYGFKLEADGVWRIPLGQASLGPVLGVGYKWWRRDYEDSSTVVGRLEKWHSAYLKFGALGEINVGGSVVPYAEAGVKLGVFNNNEVDFNGFRVSLDPGGRLTPYAEVGLKAAFLQLTAYYERIEFSQSTPEWAPGIPPGFGLVEPEVTANIFGARAGITF